MRRLWSVLAVLVVITALVTPDAWASWRQFRHGPARTGYGPSLITPANASALAVSWTRPASAQSNLSSSPALVHHHVFVGGYGPGSSTLYSYGTNGKLAWSVSVPLLSDSSPAVIGGRVFVGACDTLYAFDEATGSPLWSTEFVVLGGHACSITSPAVANGVVYVGSEGDGKLHAVDAATGTELWDSSNIDVRSSASVAGGMVLAGSNNHRLYAFPVSCQTPCAPIWSRDLGNVVEATPAISNGLVYTHSWTSPLYALDLGNGQTVWKASVQGGIVSSPAVALGVVYDLSNGGMNAYDALTGALKWSTPNVDGYGSPAATGKVVVANYRYSIRVFDSSDGTLLRSIQGGQGVFSSAAIGAKAIYASKQSNEQLYKISLP